MPKRKLRQCHGWPERPSAHPAALPRRPTAPACTSGNRGHGGEASEFVHAEELLRGNQPRPARRRAGHRRCGRCAKPCKHRPANGSRRSRRSAPRWRSRSPKRRAAGVVWRGCWSGPPEPGTRRRTRAASRSKGREPKQKSVEMDLGLRCRPVSIPGCRLPPSVKHNGNHPWNMQQTHLSWRRLLDMDIDLALLQEADKPLRMSRSEFRSTPRSRSIRRHVRA